MGFYVMVASMLLGLLALKIGFSQFKEKKDKLLSILTRKFRKLTKTSYGVS
ncbi:DUF3953 domain-containing protein, partial [Streptococcus halichoeri]|uniref:DUF3953 domain-containing protein n=1 Tax=Streptococcus halichoeri TaxID=254785 RepID=UPI001359CD01